MAGHSRSDSLASLQSAASIADLDLEAARQDTGVTAEAIEAHMAGPDEGGRWTCTYEHCGKTFGRKENIRSHVQTHLNDRPYLCPRCPGRFVRQHDLKRHSKTHTGEKPYNCKCGNGFARHDALTRHRQRGMCIGAIDGAVRKVGKRGRPRKNRPLSEVSQSRVDAAIRAVDDQHQLPLPQQQQPEEQPAQLPFDLQLDNHGESFDFVFNPPGPFWTPGPEPLPSPYRMDDILIIGRALMMNTDEPSGMDTYESHMSPGMSDTGSAHYDLPGFGFDSSSAGTSPAVPPSPLSSLSPMLTPPADDMDHVLMNMNLDLLPPGYWT